MPDYDPKSIPILDDIIEEKTTDTKGGTPDDAVSTDTAVDQIDQDDSTLDLFNRPAGEFASVDVDATNLDAETQEPEIGSIDRFIETTGAEEVETETAESALIDYNPDIEDDTDDILGRHEAQLDDFNNIEELPVEPAQHTAAPPVALETIVDDVIKQLLPDLEQQLRFLVQQALEEKLPAEIVEQISADKSD